MNVSNKANEYPAADPAQLEPWLARDGQGNYVLCIGTDVVALLGSQAVALLKAARQEQRQYRLVLEAMPPR